MADLDRIPRFPASRRETASFVLAARAAFALLGRPFAYDYLMGLSGAAFLFAAHPARSCVREWIGPLEDLYAEFLGESLGFQLIPAGWEPEGRGEAVEAPVVLRQSLQEGYPTLALGRWEGIGGGSGSRRGGAPEELSSRDRWGAVTFSGRADAAWGGLPGVAGESRRGHLAGVPRRLWLIRPVEEERSSSSIVSGSVGHGIDLLRGRVIVEPDAGRGPRWVTGMEAYDRLGERLAMGAPCSSSCAGGGWPCLAMLLGALRDSRMAAVGYLQNFVAEEREDLDGTVLGITDLYREVARLLEPYSRPEVLEAMGSVEAGREDLQDAVGALRRVDEEAASLLESVRDGLAA